MISWLVFELDIKKVFKYYTQGSTNGVRRVRTHANFYWRTHDLGHAYIDKEACFFPKICSSFSGSFNFILFKNLLLYIWALIYMFDLGSGRFFTVYICFTETLFFNFSYKLFNKYFSLCQSLCQFGLSVTK